jgi:outer membrane protein assembly factor BamB
VRVRAALRAALAACTVCVAACEAHGVQPAHPVDSAQPIASAAAVRGADWPEFDYDPQRAGVGPADTGISTRTVHRLKARMVKLDGTVDSSPIELHAIAVRGRTRDVVIVTTAYGRTIALDADTGAKLWEFTPSDIASYDGSAQITTATPIADPDRRFVYAASPDGLIHKLALSSGRQRWAARVTFDPTKEKIPSALNIDGRDVVVTTGGYDGDAPTYEGHVVLIDRGSGRIAAVWNAECSDRHHLLDPPGSCRADTSFGGSAIWARAGAVVEPGGRRILVATGNGPFNGGTDWGDSVLELGAGSLQLLHNWTPRNQASLNQSDTDLGSTAPALLPPVNGYRMAVQGGKDGMLHLIDLERLDGTTGGAGARLGGELQDIASPGSDQVFTAPAVAVHSGRTYVFVADGSGTSAYLVLRGRPPRLRVTWANGNGGTSPVLAGGLLYVYDPGGGGVRVYLPFRGREIASLPAPSGHWNSPIVVGGRVIVPTGDYHDHADSGQLLIFHLPGR